MLNLERRGLNHLPATQTVYGANKASGIVRAFAGTTVNKRAGITAHLAQNQRHFPATALT
jgi:hypothetical protein